MALPNFINKTGKNETVYSGLLEIINDAANHHSIDGQPYVSTHAITLVDDQCKEAFSRSNYASQNDPRKNQHGKFLEGKLQGLLGKMKAQAPQQQLETSRLISLYAIAVNAATHGENRETPEALITAFLQDQFKEGADREAVLAKLEKAMDRDLLISLVHTMHPTIFHSLESRKFEALLTKILENPANVQDGRLTDAGKKETREAFDGFVKGLASRAYELTPTYHQMTVPQETEAERINIAALKDYTRNIVAAWKNCVEKLPLSAEEKARITIDEKREKRIFEFRTWGQGADADGRINSTSTLLHQTVQDNLQNGVYAGPILDLRQNAEKHRDLMSALIQVEWRNSGNKRFRKDGQPTDFKEFTKEFMDGLAQKYEGRKQNGTHPRWDGPRYSLFQQLDPEDREKLMTEIIRRGYDLVPDQLAKDTREFFGGVKDETPLRMNTPVPEALKCRESLPIQQVGAQLCRFYRKEIESSTVDGKKLNADHISYKDMIDVTVPHDPNHPDGVKVSLRSAYEAVLNINGWQTAHKGKQIEPIPEAKRHNPPRMDYWNVVTPDQMLVKNLFQSTRKFQFKDDDGNIINKLSDLTDDIPELKDVFKRMVVINDAIYKYGTDVAKRYLIANFSEPSDFLIAIKLFEESGLLKLDKQGNVTETKMGIMPLLETEKDLDNAHKTFSALIDNSIARTYWEKRGEQMGCKDESGKPMGYAEIIFGFSDGAASAGNFASQWKIRQAAIALTTLFESKGIKLHILQGRGRGGERGGTDAPELHAELLPACVTKSGEYDATLQSDLPTDLAASPKYGKDYLTRILVSTLNAYLHAEERQKKEDALRDSGMDDAITGIANKASEIYNKTVRNNPAALAFFNAMPNNSKHSSRSTARGGAKVFTKFDSVRAIPKEYFQNWADLQGNNAGLMQALGQYQQAHAATGDGEAKLQELLEHPYMNAMLKTIRAGMEHFDPFVATEYGKATHSEQFVEDVKKELTGLGGRIDRLTGHQAQTVKSPQAALSSTLDQIAHSIVLTGLNDGMPNIPNTESKNPAQHSWAERLCNSLFVASQEIGHRKLQKEQHAEVAVAP